MDFERDWENIIKKIIINATEEEKIYIGEFEELIKEDWNSHVIDKEKLKKLLITAWYANSEIEELEILIENLENPDNSTVDIVFVGKNKTALKERQRIPYLETYIKTLMKDYKISR
tara:strand:- start:570 stop:917 length:348 start_codon:yes stop_codon:yes gene_type:complete